uniref:Uncharacterized protein n=1 Tax=Rhizophora mucronata TaxID=61149 RepID=A0A2P2PZE7_RHIMU
MICKASQCFEDTKLLMIIVQQ